MYVSRKGRQQQQIGQNRPWKILHHHYHLAMQYYFRIYVLTPKMCQGFLSILHATEFPVPPSFRICYSLLIGVASTNVPPYHNMAPSKESIKNALEASEKSGKVLGLNVGKHESVSPGTYIPKAGKQSDFIPSNSSICR